MSNRATRRKANSKKGGGFFAKNKLARNHGMRYEWIGQKEEQLVQKKGGQYRGLRKLSTESDFHMREKKKKWEIFY